MRIISKIKGITLEIGGDVTPLQRGIRSLNTEANSLQKELRGVETLLKMDPKNVDLLRQRQDLLNKTIGETKTKLEVLRDAKAQIDRDMANGTEVNEKEYRNLQREISFTESKLKELETTLKNTSNNWQDTADKLDKFGTKSVEVGKNLSTKVTAPIVGVGIAATKMASDFTDALAKVSTLADTQIVSMDGLKEGILSISNATGVAAKEITESVYDALSSGVETADVLDFIAANTDLARAGFTDMGTAVDITTTILNAYGDKAEDIETISNMLVKTQDLGKVTVGELGASMGKVIPTVSSLGVGLDQLGTSYAILTAKGQESTIATTNLNAMFKDLGTTGSKVDTVLRDVTGKGFQGLIEEGKSVGDVLQILDTNAKDSNIRIQELFGSANAGAAAFSLAGQNADDFNDVLKEMQNSTGTVQANLEKLETPSHKLAVALNAIKNAGIELGIILLPVLETFAKFIQNLADKFDGLTDSQKKTLVIIGGLLAAIGPLLIFIGKVSTGISAIIGVVLKVTPLIATAGGVSGIAATAVGALGAAFTFLTGPIGLTIIAITAVVAAIAWLYKKFKKTKDDIVDESDDMAKEIEESMDKINNPDSLYDPYFEIGQDINIGLADGINSNGDLPLNAIDEQSKELAEKVKENISEMDTFGAAISTALTNQYKEMQDQQLTMLDDKVANEKTASEKIIELIKQSTEDEKSIIDNRLAKLKTSTDERISEYQRDYDYRMLYLNADTATQVDGLQGQIDAIDATVKKEEEALKKKQYNDEMAELQNQKFWSQSFEERQEIEEKMKKLTQKRDADILTAKRNNDKLKLREQIEQVRKEAAIRKEQLDTELADRKKAAQDELEERTKLYKEELELLKESSTNQLQEENDRIKGKMDALNTEKESIKKHFTELLTQENIQAKARELIIKGNNDDIITLLNNYNPKWQDAGQSFGDSIVNGLRSKKDSMHKAIAELMKIPTVKINAQYSLSDISSSMGSVSQPTRRSTSTINNQTKQDVTQNINVSVKADDLNQVQDVVKLFNDLRPTVRAGVV